MAMATRCAGGGTMSRARKHLAARVAIYTCLIAMALFVLGPLYVMVITSLKHMSEISSGNILALPHIPTIAPWLVSAHKLSAGFLNSVKILIPSVIISIAVGAIAGYALQFWRLPGASLLVLILLIGAFIPYAVFIYPLVRILAFFGLFGTLTGIVIVHTTFGLPVMTILFKNFYSSLPVELFKAARVDGAGFWRIFASIVFPMSTPIVIVAVILQVTGIWNDFLLGLVFAGRDNMPMTVELNNIVTTTTGTRFYNQDMAATILTAAVPLLVYLVSGRWFVRGITAGAVKG
ncbi:MAG: carbohydrate ABC transporter permease [Hyphomicrobiales bacterium]|nr:carbohydrate ABC transporter permease [Hyphomicrobiales bacterium]